MNVPVLSLQRMMHLSKGHTDGVQFASVLQDGNVISASWDRTLRVWDPRNGNCLKVMSDHTGEVLHVNQLADGRIVSASMDATIKVTK